MKTVEYKGKTYFVNGLQGDLKDRYNNAPSGFKHHVLFKHDGPVLIYNHKNFQGNPDYLGFAVDILRDVKQPTQTQVRNAMIYTIGYPGEKPDYCLKAGGEAQSDSMFSSSLTVMIAHPKTGLDTHVVILKKYSTKFEDVLITEDEVRSLYKLCKSPSEDKKIKQGQVESGIALLWRSFQGFKIGFAGGLNRKATPAEIIKIKELVEENGSEQTINAHLDRLQKSIARDLDVTLDEANSSQTTAQFHDAARAKLEKFNEFRVSLFGTRQAA